MGMDFILSVTESTGARMMLVAGVVCMIPGAQLSHESSGFCHSPGRS